MTAAAVDFYYAIGSRYSYLAATQVPTLAAETGARIEWVPIDSVRLRSMRGVDPFRGTPVSAQYEWSYRELDARRWAALYGVPFVEPVERVEFDPELLALACTAARRLGQVQAYSRELFRLVFATESTAIGTAECLDAAHACGLAGADFQAALDAPATRLELDLAQAKAISAGVPGVPAFVAGKEVFWGNDRLVLLRHHLLRLAMR
ncbi:MAG: DsbA family protein [Gammaproteobacteria bacterium]|nr:DsbA family protein [Gammaproteobacteria bacterium]